ncbi:MAG: beta-lactamase family protein [Deltaproteobacteria bacterium]|nr:beta-lactamase family protein [Deltaproteobacteria bacterium]MBW2535861.1 beta-lactamase family protein [Deltaproteobacteria bacterium]
MLATAVQQGTFPGLAAGVVVGDRLMWSGGWGHADLDTRRGVSAATRFRIASITKTFVGVGLLMAHERGAFAWDDPACLHVPEIAKVVYPTRDSPRITIRHLVTHTAGLPRVEALDYASEGGRALDEPGLLALLDGMRLESAPGTGVRYSNLGAALAAVVLGRVSGAPPTEVLRREVVVPLGMTGTEWRPGAASVSALAAGYRQKADGSFVRGRPWPLRVEAPVVGLYSNVTDMARYAAFHLQAWPPDDVVMRAGVTAAALRSSHVAFGPAIPGGQAHGVFWMIDGDPTLGHVVRHSGSTALYSATLWLLPRRDLAVVLLANTGNVASQRLDELAREVLLALLDADPDPSPEVSRPVAAAIRTVKSLLLEPSVDTIRRRFSRRFLQSVPAEELVRFFERHRRVLGACREHHVLRADADDSAVVRLYCAEGEMRVTVHVRRSSPHEVAGLILEAFPQSDGDLP